MEILEFVFQSFWHWAGTVVLIGTFGAAIGSTLSVFRRGL